jgi:hypothetical protein
MRPAAPILTDQARTSSDAQRKIARPPMPFADAQQGSLQRVPTQKDFRSTGNPKELNYEISTKHSIHNGTKMSADMMAAVGYGPSDTMSTESIISGNPTRNNQRRAGKPGSRNSNTSARENSRMRQG